MARISYVDPEDLPEDKRHLVVSQRTRDKLRPEVRHLMSDQETRNFYRALGNVPSIADGFRTIQNACWEDGGLSTFQREYVILSVARYANSEYEWNNHVRVALDEGLSSEEIIAISRGDLDSFDEADRTLVRYALAVLDDEVDDELHESMAEHFDQNAILGASMLAGVYYLNALVGEALAVDIERDERWVGWELENVEMPSGTE